MSCEECREHLAEVAGGGGSGAVRAHVDSCSACQEQVRLFHETWKLMLASPAVKPSPGFAHAVKEKTHQGTNRILRWVAPLIGLAAAILLVVYSLHGTTEPAVDPAAFETELGKLSDADKKLFGELTADENTWDLAENLDDMRAVDLAAPDKLGQEQYLLGEKKP